MNASAEKEKYTTVHTTIKTSQRQAIHLTVTDNHCIEMAFTYLTERMIRR